MKTAADYVNEGIDALVSRLPKELEVWRERQGLGPRRRLSPASAATVQVFGQSPGRRPSGEKGTPGEAILNAWSQEVAGSKKWSRITVLEGSGQRGAVGTALGCAPAARVTDVFGNPTAGATVTFAVKLGAGKVDPGRVATDPTGVARAKSWTLGANLGMNTITATTDDGKVVTFWAVATK